MRGLLVIQVIGSTLGSWVDVIDHEGLEVRVSQ